MSSAKLLTLAATIVSASALAIRQTPVNTSPSLLYGHNDAGFCLTAEGTQNGAVVEIEQCNNLANQIWTFENGSVTMFNGTKCLDVKDGVKADGTLLQLWDCTSGNTNQQWYYTGDNRSVDDFISHQKVIFTYCETQTCLDEHGHVPRPDRRCSRQQCHPSDLDVHRR